MNAENTHTLKTRSEVSRDACWNLQALFRTETDWETAFQKLGENKERIAPFKGTLGNSPEALRACLDFRNEMEQSQERLSYYAFLKTAEDGTNSESQGRQARFLQLSSECAALFSFFEPELQAIPKETWGLFWESGILEPYGILLQKILRYRPHILSEGEERLLAMQAEFGATPKQAFSALTNMDMSFGFVETPEGRRELTQSTFAVFRQHPDRRVRQEAYEKFYGVFDQHKHTLAALYNGNVQKDVFEAKARRFPSALEGALFDDNVPQALYDNLIRAVRAHLPALRRYYALRKKVLALPDFRLYDTRVPLVDGVRKNHSYEQAVDLVLEAVSPLGPEYANTLRQGLLGGWVDRFENKGKQSGAFSAGSYHGDPYILLNYKEDVQDDVFTLAHEAGHSMHSWYSVRHNPFSHYRYTIFVAEVASTFNEQLLAQHWMRNTPDEKFKAYLLDKQITDMIGTIYRQTMFAEFEKITHAMVERGEPLTVASLRAQYRKLLEDYFGPDTVLEEVSDLECFYIPHFYSAFYVYKYATGLSAAIALSERVLQGGKKELDQYMSFLKSGGSRFPLEQLKDAGVDMITPEPVDTALQRFGRLVDALEASFVK